MTGEEQNLMASQKLESEPAPFLPNNHSKFKIEWNKVGNEEAGNLLEIFGRHYLCEDVESVEQVGEWEKMSNNYKIKFASGNQILFRRHIQLKEKAQIDFLNNVLLYLSARGLKVPTIIPMRDGQSEALVDSHFYQAFDFIPGDHFRGEAGELEDAAGNIALLHNALAEMPVSKDEEMWERPLLPAWDKEGWKKIFEKVNLSEDSVSKICKKYSWLIEGWLKKIGDNHKGLSSLTSQPIHGDLHPQNTIFLGGKLVAILDFEGVRIDSVVRDFGNAMHRFVRQYVVNAGGQWQDSLPKGLKLFIDAYNRLSQLPTQEIKYVPFLVADEILRKLFKDLNLFFQGYGANIDEQELLKKLNLLNEVSLIQDHFKF